MRSSTVNFSKLLYTTLIGFLLLFTISVQPVVTQGGNVGFNWQYAGFDDHSTNFNPQTALNKNNVEQLKQEWMTVVSITSPLFGADTVLTTSSTLLMHGIVYLIDQVQIISARKADDNSIMWSTPLSVGDPERFGLENETVHIRLLTYYDQKIWLIDLDCSIKGFNAIIGTIEVEIPPQVLCGAISPEVKTHNAAIRVVSAPVFYEEESIMIAAPSGFETEDRSLSYVVGISLDTQDIVWKTPLVANGRGNLNLGIGQWPVDQEAGVVYIGTGSPIPEWNATNRPGANLYSNSIIALDASTGEILWYYQVAPHDLNGYGCTNNLILGEIDGEKAVYAACRNGYLYALDAETGDLLWYFDPPAVKRMNSENADFVKTGTYDPEKPWLNHPSIDPVVQCPGVFGAVSSNIALAYGTVYMATFNSCSRLKVTSVEKIGDTGVMNITDLYEPVGPVNSTLYAVDAFTGEEKWNRFFDAISLKGGITVSGGLVYLPSPDSVLHAFDATTGSPVWERNFGTVALAFPPVIGATARGNWTLFQMVGGTPLLEEVMDKRSSYLFAFSLPQAAVTTTFEEPTTSTPDYYLIATYGAVATAIVLLITAILFYSRRRR